LREGRLFVELSIVEKPGNVADTGDSAYTLGGIGR
jgi:hypothetical protein